MSTSKPNPQPERRGWGSILLTLLVGSYLVFVAGQQGLHFAPSWKLDASFDSNIDLNSEYLTGRPDQFFEPLDPAILTRPAWARNFLTPGASSVSGTPFATPFAQATPTGMIPTTAFGTLPVATSTLAAGTASPTHTFVYIPPPATRTSRPSPVDTATNAAASLISADLQITQSDGTTTYIPGGTLTYILVVSNPGTSSVNNAIVTDIFPAQVTGAGWTCLGVGGGTCTASGVGILNDVVNLPTGSSITYTVSVNISASASGNLDNQVAVNLPAGYTEIDPSNNAFVDTNTPLATADLWITKDDGATAYAANGTLTYTITIGNSGPSNITGATVSDNFPGQIASTNWTCTGSAGTFCTASGSGAINDVVNLPGGASLVYQVTANISSGPSGNLVNTASVNPPAGSIDPVPGNNSATDPKPDVLIVTNVTPGQIGTAPGGGVYTLSTGSSLTLNTNIVVSGNSGPDLIYYELPVGGGGVDLDWVILQVSDGYNWYTILNWGDGAGDANTNIDINTIGGAEADNRHFNASDLYNSTGIAIDLDSVVPPGIYPYIRIIAPPGDVPLNDGCDIDAIEILP